MAISVGVVVGAVGDALIEKLKPRIAALRIRDGMDADADMGPVVTATHREKILGYIEAGIAEGAHLVCDGRAHDRARPRRRILPRCHAVRSGQADDEDLSRGDLRSGAVDGQRVPDLAAALDLVNAHEFGNGVACLHGRRRHRARVCAPRAVPAWSASMCRFRCRWPSTRSVAGSARCSATTTPTAKRRSASTRATRA